MEITIKNCNCLDEVVVQIDEGKLNIKYAMNGTGKSTISKAIELNVKGNGSINVLKPFKYRDKGDEPQYLPSVAGADSIKSVKVFNEEYIGQFVFRPDEVINNSFEIFIRSPEYDRGMEEIEAAFKEIKETFTQNKALDEVIRDLSELSNGFGKSASGYSKAGAIHKGLGNGNKLEHIPPGLEPYKSFLQSPKNVSWLKWQLNGKEFLEISGECPYCVSPTEGAKKETILSVEKEYDAKSLEHLTNILRILDSLSGYFSDETNANLRKITTNKATISEEEINYLREIKTNVDILRDKLTSLKHLSFFSFKDVEKVIEKLTALTIKIEFLPRLDSQRTREIVDSVNTTLDGLLKKANDIQRAIGIQKSNIRKTIQAHKNEINSFLTYAGYKYFVDIEDENDVYKMKLKHIDFSAALEKGNQHLSYGEKNAFSLVLFMYETLRETPDLIVLDDPISSFDRNKKFAILDTLFRREKSFKDMTVLMMTHDLEPVIDTVHSLAGKFKSPSASFLSAQAGKVIEVPIKKDDIMTFSEVCQENIASDADEIVKLVYLRRKFEVNGDKGAAYQLISNLLHKRPTPLWQDGAGIREMSEIEIAQAAEQIGEMVPGFDYQRILSRLTDDAEMITAYKMAQNNYEKLQIYRIIYANKTIHESDVIAKFINEAFHIENEYLMQLNPRKYETTPNFIIAECDRLLKIA